MFDFIVMPNIFDARVNNTMPVLEKWRQMSACYVTVFINSGRQYCAAMFPIPTWIVGAATKKRNSERGSGNDHAYSITQDFAVKMDAGHIFDIFSFERAKFLLDKI
jgi:hypothetical protein